MKKLFSVLAIIGLLTLTGCKTELNHEPGEEVYSQESSNTLLVEDKTYNSPHHQNQSVYELMTKLQNETDFSFDGTDYGEDLGFFVEEINGIKNDSEANTYWIYYINNETAVSGISTYILEPDDTITWKYEAYN